MGIQQLDLPNTPSPSPNSTVWVSLGKKKIIREPIQNLILQEETSYKASCLTPLRFSIFLFTLFLLVILLLLLLHLSIPLLSFKHFQVFAS